MGIIKNIYKRIAPASKGQLNNKMVCLEKIFQQNHDALKEDITQIMTDSNAKLLKQIKTSNKNVIDRLERIERMVSIQTAGVTQEKRSPEIIIAMTSYGERVNTIPLVLERLLNQTVRPDRIVLYLSEVNFPQKEESLPQRLLDMQMVGLEIHWCQDDIKSYKKLIPALREYPEDIIITVDDDIYYDLDLIERLYDSYRRFPRAISALRAHRMKFDESGKILPYADWDKCVSGPLYTPLYGMFATTGAGTLFPPHIFTGEVFCEEKFMSACVNADDIWVRVMSVISQVPTVLASEDRKLKCVAGTQKDSLWSTNKFENDEQLQATLHLYENYLVDGKHIEEIIFEEYEKEYQKSNQ